MATFNHNFSVDTSNDGSNLIITDLSEYNSDHPKSLFTSRTVTIIKTDNTEQVVNFPFTNSSNATQDTIVVEGFFDKDYYLTIKLEWRFQNATIDELYTTEKHYLSNYFALICFVSLADESDCSCGCEGLDNLTKLNNYIETATLWAKYGNGVKAQKYLDACREICNSLNDCNCNT